MSAKSLLLKHEYKLQELNDFLSDKSYLEDTVFPSDLDCETFDVVKKLHKIQYNDRNTQETNCHLPHFFRWFRHISSFTEEQRLNFPKYSSHLSEKLKNHGSIIDINNRVCTQT